MATLFLFSAEFESWVEVQKIEAQIDGRSQSQKAPDASFAGVPSAVAPSDLFEPF